jgi:hypothetical protein
MSKQYVNIIIIQVNIKNELQERNYGMILTLDC